MTALRASLGWIAVALLAAGAGCQRHPNIPAGAAIPSGALAEATDEAPSGPTRVTVYIKTVVEKRYGVLAYLGGCRNTIEKHLVYMPGNSWWDNPLVVYKEQPLSSTTDLTAGADGAEMVGTGTSANVAVNLLLIPHAEIALQTLPRCDAIKGTIQVRISAASDYFDGSWTPMADVQDKTLVFAFDTRDPSRPLETIGREVRSVSAFSFERYIRDKQKWQARNTWPAQPESGDWRITISGNEATMDIVTYRYSSQSVTAK